MKNLIILIYSLFPVENGQFEKSYDDVRYYGTYRSEQSCQSAGTKLAKYLEDDYTKVEVLCQSK